MLHPELLWLGLVALCVACQPQQEAYNVERGRTYGEAKAVVWDGILRFLEANDITAVSADPATGVIQAERTEYQDAIWADCERAWVIDRTSNSQRPDRARPLSRDLALEVAVRESAAGTEVQPVARFTEQQNDPYRNWPFTQPCRSTGVLESALLNALGGTPASTATPSSGSLPARRSSTAIGRRPKPRSPIWPPIEACARLSRNLRRRPAAPRSTPRRRSSAREGRAAAAGG
jgi:hypothetical protein